MLQIKPTFSESWYRVAGLKPRLRAGAHISRQFYRGERWYVVRDPAGNQYHRLSDPAYRFLGLLDGRRTVVEAWDLVGGQLADDAPTQPEVIQILSQLYAANLLETDITPDSTVLLRRHKQLVKRKMQNRMMNVLFPRMPIWDPDRFLVRWMPVARVLFSKFGAFVWIVMLTIGLVTVLPHWQDLRLAAIHALDLQNNLENLFFLYATFVVIKFIHECGHAFACRRFGGECHEMGIMLLVIVPTPYVDASGAWSFPNKWHRIFVGCAGMIVELFFASICAIVWRMTDPNTSPLISELSYNAMLIASVTTVIFNANPLLRYDGYYILADLLEIPNLRQRSTDYSMGLIKRHLFGVKSTQPLPPPGQRVLLFLYAILSSIYRMFVGLLIILIVTYKVPVLGVLMGLGGVVTWVGVPAVKISRYLLLEPELNRKRTRAIAISAVFAALLVVLIGLIRMPMHVDFAGIVEPDDPVDSRGIVQTGVLACGGSGQVVGIYAKDGDFVHAGQVILQLDDPTLQRDLDEVNANIREYDARYRKSQTTDMSEAHTDMAYLRDYQSKLADVKERIEALKVKAPFDGQLIAPELPRLPGTYLPRGQEIGQVAVLHKLIIKGDIDQTDAQLVQNSGQLIARVRLAGLISQVLDGGDVRLYPAAMDTLAHPSLGTAGGGDTPVDPSDPKGMKSVVPQFEADINLDNSSGQYYPGQRAYVRIILDKQAWIWQWTRRFLQLLQSRDTGKWI